MKIIDEGVAINVLNVEAYELFRQSSLAVELYLPEATFFFRKSDSRITLSSLLSGESLVIMAEKKHGQVMMQKSQKRTRTGNTAVEKVLTLCRLFDRQYEES